MVSKKSKKRSTNSQRKRIIGENLNFAGSEAYKLLRTNIMLSIPANGKCRIIGITSSAPAEGKSTTAMNLAYTLAESKQRVLYMEADMRRPVASETFGITAEYGLSNLLTGACSLKEAVVIGVKHPTMAVLPAGDIPPNPAELLSSAQMDKILGLIAATFDYIIIDFPPINSVADALVLAKHMDGMVMVVRKDYCDKRGLAEAMRHMEHVGVKVLGFVMNDETSKTDKYGYY